MKKQKTSLIRVLSIAVLVVTLVFQVFPLQMASAAQITTRSLTLEAQVGDPEDVDGGSMAGGLVNHKFLFTVPNVGNTNIGSIKFEYCTLAAGVPVATDCTMPTGLVTTTAALGASEVGATGFTMVNTTNGAPYLTRTSASVAAGTVLGYTLENITNPTTINETFFVRIKTYASDDTTGSATDAGTVNASTAEQIVLDGIMPESLVFCTGATVGLNGVSGLPDCATATSGEISFNQLFSPTDTAVSTSQMSASTNAGSGYVISVNGPTLMSGSNTISPMNAQGISLRGSSQFGLNLVVNTTTATAPFGVAVTPVANATNYRGQAATNYDLAESFKFTSGNIVANSANGGAGATDAQILTVAYIVNVPGSQPAGTYSTTLTYICTPTF